MAEVVSNVLKLMAAWTYPQQPRAFETPGANYDNPRIRVVPRPKKEDSSEVYIGEEFIGVLFLDDEDGDRSYNFQMAILETDLE